MLGSQASIYTFTLPTGLQSKLPTGLHSLDLHSTYRSTVYTLPTGLKSTLYLQVYSLNSTYRSTVYTLPKGLQFTLYLQVYSLNYLQVYTHSTIYLQIYSLHSTYRSTVYNPYTIRFLLYIRTHRLTIILTLDFILFRCKLTFPRGNHDQIKRKVVCF